MRLFGRKKKEPEVQEISYEIFGGFTIKKTSSGYEITWRSPNITTLNVRSEPVIDDDVQIKREDDTIQVLTTGCKLKLIKENGDMKAHISKI
ncbi:hypothetical protein CW704_04095 [Candidatus Bathyarchaeota archaeon]|nr:MAG: hypothetical protein CW704_04095 [Candidatus Bathyarchaeota archaeon]